MSRPIGPPPTKGVAIGPYIALFRYEPASGYSVHFPGVPHILTGGDTLEEAHRMAQEALALHAESLRDDGEPIPEPMTLEAIMVDPENRDAVPVLVALWEWYSALC